MVSFRNMDKFAAEVANNRVNRREPVQQLQRKELRLGDVIHVDGEDWTIYDFCFKTQSVHLCRGKRFNFVKIQELM